MKVGYARVSTNDQDLALQHSALKRAGCARIFSDTASGANATRPELRNCLSHLRKGDRLVVWKLDRLGRSLKDLLAILTDLDQRDIQFHSLTETINTSTPMGRFFYQVMGALAEVERELIRERSRAGLAAARARGRKGGRPRKLTAGKLKAARTLLDSGTPAGEVANHFGVGVSTLYRYLSHSEEPL